MTILTDNKFHANIFQFKSMDGNIGTESCTVGVNKEDTAKILKLV